MKTARGFTLLEMMLVLLLVSLIYVLITFAVVQVSNVTRVASVAAIHKKALMDASERLRWQLRGLFLDPDGGIPGGNVTSTATTPTNTSDPRLLNRLPGLIGTPGASMYGQTDTAGQDYILMLTSAPFKSRAITEVDYRVTTAADAKVNLMYRQFPVRSVGGFHDLSDTNQAPWVVLLENVSAFRLDYSNDGVSWQRTWDSVVAPRRVHVHLETTSGERLDYQVTPGIGGGRW